MKKSTKILLGIGAAIATPIIINHVIAKKAEARIAQKSQENTLDEHNVYEWEYGNIRYTTAGEGKPLLLLHGLYLGAFGMEWEDVVGYFAQDYKVYIPDLLGFGYSDKPAIDYCSYLFVRLIKDFAENVISEPVTAVASLHTAAALVSCASLNPEDFKKIVLISPAGLESETPLAQDEDNIMKKVLESPVLGTSFYNALCSKKGFAGYYKSEGHILDDGELERIYLAAHSGGAQGKYALAALFGKFFNTDIKYTITQLEMPYSIITGDSLPENDDNIFTGYHNIDDAFEIKLVEGAGTMPHTEKPEEFYNLFKSL